MTAKTKILVLEDEPAVAAFMTFLLPRAGYGVETDFTGRNGLELATKKKKSESKITTEGCPLFEGHQSPIWTSKRQLNPERRGEQEVDFARLDFLQIAGGDLRPFRERLLCQPFTHPLPAHVRAEGLDPFPFFSA